MYNTFTHSCTFPPLRTRCSVRKSTFLLERESNMQVEESELKFQSATCYVILGKLTSHNLGISVFAFAK